MSRYWKRRTAIRDGKLINLKRLVRFGNSFAFVLPSEYVRYTCSPDEQGKLWVEVRYNSEDSAFIIKGFREAIND